MRTFTESERELSEYFLSALGVGAQGYEPSSSGEFNSTDALAKKMFGRQHFEAVKAHRATEWTLEQVGSADIRTLTLAFHPRRVGSGMYQAGLGRLAALGIETAAARALHQEWQTLGPRRLETGLLAWLDDEATRGSERAQKAIREEAETRLVLSLARYDVQRVERLRIQKRERFEKEERTSSTMLVAMGEKPTARVKAGVRPELASISNAIAALIADNADLLEPAE